jgi:hypothetical protein
MAQQIAPFIGYVASLFLIISLLVNGDIKFRIYNGLGSVAFIIYGILFNAWPVILTNVILLIINIIYLNKLYRYRENFELIEFTGEEKLMLKFLEFYSIDIKTFFPDFNIEQLKANYNFVVLRDLVIANAFSAHIADNGDATVLLNYTTKKYRDYKVSKFIFEKEKQILISKGVKRIVYNKIHHKNYKTLLAINGFVAEGDRYVKELVP